MLMSIKTWLFETPSKDCMARYAKSGENRHLEQLIASTVTIYTTT